MCYSVCELEAVWLFLTKSVIFNQCSIAIWILHISVVTQHCNVLLLLLSFHIDHACKNFCDGVKNVTLFYIIVSKF